MSRFPRDQDAVASGVVTFLVAGVIFMGSIGTVLVVSHNSNSGVAASEAPAAVQKTNAESLAQLVLGSPGYAANGTDWVPSNLVGAGVASAEGLKRLGLKDGASSDPLMMSFAKFENLRLAKYATNATDGRVNYPEARAGLGLADSGLNFHIRAYPTLPSTQQMTEAGEKDENLRITYIANAMESDGTPPATPGAGLTISTPTCTASSFPNAYHIAATLHNGGSTPTIFFGVFGVEFSEGDYYSNNARTVLVPAGGDAELSVDVASYRTNSQHRRVCGAGTEIELTVKDANLVTLGEREHELTAAQAADVAYTTKDLYLDATPVATAPGASATINYGGKSLGNNDKLTLKLFAGTSEAGTLVSTTAITVPGNAAGRTLQVAIPATPDPQQYYAVLYYAQAASITSSTLRAGTLLYAASAAPAGYSAAAPTGGAPTYTAGGTVVDEVAMLEELAQKFCPTYADSKVATPLPSAVNWATRCAFKGAVSDTSLLQGDILPDAASGNIKLGDLLTARLLAGGVPTLAHTNVLVVGSNVDHSDMSPADVKKTIGDWVEAGGTLIVFGSDDKSYTWLESVCSAKTQSSSTALSAPDTSSPILNTPNVLDWTNYYNFQEGWDINKDKCGYFTPVVVSGTAPNQVPVLTVSDPGSYGNGNVILTTWRGYDVYGTTNSPPWRTNDAASTYAEGLKLTHNLLMQGYRGLFLDYGPSIPADTNVIPAVRFVQIQHPNFDDPLQLAVVVYVFK